MSKIATYFHFKSDLPREVKFKPLIRRFFFIIFFLPFLLSFCGEKDKEKWCVVPPTYHSLSGDLLDTAQALADEWMELPPENNWWDWKEAVLMFGLVKLY